VELSQTERDWSKHFVLTAHIDLQGHAWSSAVIGEFRGSLDGAGYEIRNLAVSGEAPVGLVGVLYDTGQVKRLGVVDAKLVGTDTWSNDEVAILAGSNYGLVDRCYTSGSVKGDTSVGGLVGINKGRVVNCHSAAAVAGEHGVGGLVGRNAYGGELRRCYSVGSVHGTDDVGGLVGSDASLVIHCVWDIESSGQTASSGGIGLTTLQMMDPHYLGLNGWANDPTWRLDAGKDYPRLAWEGHVGQVIPRPNIEWIEGSGSLSDPYRLTDVRQLQRINQASMFWESQLVLANDVDLDGLVWDRAVFPVFGGYLDGNGFSLRNLSMHGDSDLGLIGRLTETGQVYHLRVTDANIVGSGHRVGIIAGVNEGLIVGCQTAGTLAGENYVGALSGSNDGWVSHCLNASVVSGHLSIGGLVGSSGPGSTVACSHSLGEVNGAVVVGGLIGESFGAQVMQCYSAGVVHGEQGMGGLVGDSYGGEVNRSFWDIERSGQSASAGGLGLSTEQMLDRQIYVEAGWDFQDETANGSLGIWQMKQGTGYPVLSMLNGSLPPGLEGEGTGGSPYLLASARDLKAVVYHNARAHYRLTRDIDLQGDPWLGPVLPIFGGRLDGDNCTIRALAARGEDHLGLIGKITHTGQVCNLGIVDANVVGFALYTGVLAGRNDGTIENCYASGVVTCASTGGGLVGHNQGKIGHSHTLGAVRGKGRLTGGLVGFNEGQVVRSYSRAAVRGGRSDAGGLVGLNAGEISHCFSTGDVIYEGGYGGVGGLVGNNFSGSVLLSYCTGSVTGLAWITTEEGYGSIGGLVGMNVFGFVSHCYSTGVVRGGRMGGGLIGALVYGSVTRCFSSSPVSSGEHVGGLIARNSYGEVWGSVWDTDRSGRTFSDGGVGLSTRQIKDPYFLALNGWANDPHWRHTILRFNGWAPDPRWAHGFGRDYPSLAWEERLGGLIPEPAIDWIDGNGTPEDPFQLVDADQLLLMRLSSIVLEGHLALMHDIDLDGSVWTDAVLPSFSGHFNGNGFAIENPTIIGRRNLGFIGALMPTGRLDNLGVTNANVLGQGDAVGILAGRSNGRLNHCYSSGWVMGEDYVGGLIGYHSDGQLLDCHSTSTVSGNLYVGGLIGQNRDGHLSACHSTSTVRGSEHLGGLVGRNDAGQLNLCRSTSTVTGDLYIGGIVGRNEGEGQLTDCHSTGELRGNQYVGGLIGYHEDDFSLIVDCSSTAQVIGNAHVQELVGNAPPTQRRGR